MVKCQTGDGSQKVEQQIQCYACGLPNVNILINCAFIEHKNIFFTKSLKIAFVLIEFL